MKPEEELQQIEALCRNLGAPEEQAKRMASQLVKRADQWVEQRGMTRVEAMKSLLELVVSGRQGTTPPGFEGENGFQADANDDF